MTAPTTPALADDFGTFSDQLKATVAAVEEERNAFMLETQRLTILLRDKGVEADYLRQDLEREKSAHAADVELIGRAFMDATDDDEEIYDDVVSRINPRLSVELAERTRNYEVRIGVRVTLTVSATNADNARDAAEGDIRAIENMIDNFSVDTAVAVTSRVDADYEWDVEAESSY